MFDVAEGVGGKEGQKGKVLDGAGVGVGGGDRGVDDLYNKNVIQMVKKIMADKQHPLHANYVFL